MTKYKPSDTRNDPHVENLFNECKELGIEADVAKRWENGIEHHPEAERIFKLIKESDWAFGNDYFCWKDGGDGDNGECLKFTLSVLLELREKS